MKRYQNRRQSLAAGRSVAAAQIQELESKQLLTGTVTVALSDDGDLSLTGDSKDNEVVVDIDETGVSIRGVNGTSVRIGDETFDPGETATIAEDAVVPRDLSVKMKGGDDSVEIYVDDAASVGRNVDIDMGKGDDFLLLFATDEVSVGGKLSVKSGSGSDYVEISTGGEDGSIEVAGDASIDTGSGDDGLFIGDWDLLEDVIDDGEPDGEDPEPVQAAGAVEAFLDLVDNSDDPEAQAVKFAGKLSVKTGTGNDSLGILGVAVGLDASIHTGTGHGDVLGISNLSVGRDLKLTYGDLNAVQNVTVGGKTTVKSGTGDDRFAIDRVTLKGDAEIHLGPGKDELALGEGVVAEKNVKLRGGAGNDQLASAIDLDGADVSGFEGTAVDFEAIVEDVLAQLSLFV